MAEPLSSLQAAFAAHLRNPDANPAPADIEERRMAIYRDLFFRNLSNFIARSFPVLRKLYSDAAWSRLIRAFFDQHRCHTPLFPEIPREFLQYLETQRAGHPDDPPFALELAHYEWMETALDLEETDINQIPADARADLLDGVPAWSPLAWPLAYHYPVHRIRPDFQPAEPGPEPTLLLVYRNREDQVRFMQLDKLAMRLAGLVQENSARPGLYLLKALAGELGMRDEAGFIEQGHRLLVDWRQRDVILGVQERAR